MQGDGVRSYILSFSAANKFLIFREKKNVSFYLSLSPLKAAVGHGLSLDFSTSSCLQPPGANAFSHLVSGFYAVLDSLFTGFKLHC